MQMHIVIVAHMCYNYSGGGVMKCENLYCIYNDEDKCILESVSLDIQGKCKECIYVDITDDQLKKLKKEQLM